jgi:hypothetical protein
MMIKDQRVSRRFAPTLHPRRSTLKNQPVIFDDGIGKQIAADFVKLGFCLGAIEFEFDEFSDAGAFDCWEAMLIDGIADRHSLRVEDALLWQHDDLGFHSERQTMGEAAGFKREVAALMR